MSKSEAGGAKDLVANLIEWAATSLKKGRARVLVTNVARASTANRVRNCIEEGFREVLHLEDLCRAIGVGSRTLQRCFREHYRLTISQYLLSVRLHATHRELSAARPQERSVTEIALRNGFTHLGRF